MTQENHTKSAEDILFEEVFTPEFVKAANARLKQYNMDPIQSDKDLNTAFEIAQFVDKAKQSKPSSFDKVASTLDELRKQTSYNASSDVTNKLVQTYKNSK